MDIRASGKLISTVAAAAIMAAVTPVNSQQPGEQQLPEVKVQAAPARDPAPGPVEGYVADRSATATKTDTPLIETPQSISVITRDRLDEQNVQRFDEALRYTPGLYLSSAGFDIRFPSIQLRGLPRALTNIIYRDGLHTRNPGFAATLIPEPYGAERIEVLRGPASVLYGQGAPGGLVNYVTKRPTLLPLREIQLEAGNYDRRALKFDFGGPIDQDGVFSFRLTGLGRDSETQVDFVDDDRIYIAPAITVRPSNDTSWTLLSHYQKAKYGRPVLPAQGGHAAAEPVWEDSTQPLYRRTGLRRHRNRGVHGGVVVPTSRERHLDFPAKHPLLQHRSRR